MPPAVARVVVNERTGTVVMGGQVVLRPVAIAHGGMRITVGATPATMPIPGVAGSGTTRTLVTASGTTVDDLVRSLNALGVSPRDLITILQALKRASALQADLVTM
jgi:flagellar P-ring protein precursor FlgI